MGLNWLNWLQLVQSVITLRGMQLIAINAIIRQTTPTRDIEMASSSVALSILNASARNHEQMIP